MAQARTAVKKVATWDHEITFMSREEIFAAVQDDRWQRFRLSLKGKSTEEKLRMLEQYRQNRIEEAGGVLRRRHEVQIDNYINALLRGGQLKRVGNRVEVQR